MEHIREQAASADKKKFEKGDRVIYHPKSSKTYHKKFDGKEFVVRFIYTNGEDYSISDENNVDKIVAGWDELTKVDNYIETQFKKKEESPKSTEQDTTKQKSNLEIADGSRVSVTGKQGKYEYNGQKGTVIRSDENNSLVEFDDDDSKNQRGHTSLINNKMITVLDEPSIKLFKVGDMVECVDQTSEFYKKTGEVDRIFDDGDIMVHFKATAGDTYIPMGPHQVKIVSYASSDMDSFKKTIPVGGGAEKEVKLSEEEEDEDDEVTISKVTFKKEDLLEFSYKDFLLEEKISTKEELLTNKKKYEEALKEADVPEFRKMFIERSLRTAEIIESYFDFLIHKIAKEGIPVYRTLETIENEDLLRTKTKVRASESKELTRKYSFDQGIIAYWKFKDALVFKTI